MLSFTASAFFNCNWLISVAANLTPEQQPMCSALGINGFMLDSSKNPLRITKKVSGTNYRNTHDDNNQQKTRESYLFIVYLFGVVVLSPRVGE